jgi:hypothetical protein
MEHPPSPLTTTPSDATRYDRIARDALRDAATYERTKDRAIQHGRPDLARVAELRCAQAVIIAKAAGCLATSHLTLASADANAFADLALGGL